MTYRYWALTPGLQPSTMLPNLFEDHTFPYSCYTLSIDTVNLMLFLNLVAALTALKSSIFRNHLLAVNVHKRDVFALVALDDAVYPVEILPRGTSTPSQ